MRRDKQADDWHARFDQREHVSCEEARARLAEPRKLTFRRPLETPPAPPKQKATVEELEASMTRMFRAHDKKHQRVDEKRAQEQAEEEEQLKAINKFHKPENFNEGAWDRNYNEHDKRQKRMQERREKQAKALEEEVQNLLTLSCQRHSKGSPKDAAWTSTRLYLDAMDKENRLTAKREIQQFGEDQYLRANSVHALAEGRRTGAVFQRLFENTTCAVRGAQRCVQRLSETSDDLLHEELLRLAEETELEAQREAEEQKRKEAEADEQLRKKAQDTGKGEGRAEKSAPAARGTAVLAAGGKGRGGAGASRGTMVGGGQKGKGGGAGRGTMGGKGK